MPRLRDDYDIRPVAFVDGVHCRIVNKWSKSDVQGEDYSGKKKYALRKMILVFDPTGRLVTACRNCPGKWYDAECTTKQVCIGRYLSSLKASVSWLIRASLDV